MNLPETQIRTPTRQPLTGNTAVSDAEERLSPVLNIVVPCYNEEEVLPTTAQRLSETIDDLIEGYRVALLPVHRTQVIRRLGYAMAYYRRASKPDLLCALQLVWPDRAGRLPQDPACVPEVARLQPLLDREVPPEELRAFLARYGSKSN